MDLRISEVEKRICRIASMNRNELVEFLSHLNCSFTMDFSQDFLESLTEDKLRHIVMAASLHDNSHAA